MDLKPPDSGRLQLGRGEPAGDNVQDDIITESSSDEGNDAEANAEIKIKKLKHGNGDRTDDYFKDLELLNVPWTYKREGSSDHPEFFDDLQCMSLELNYQTYYKEKQPRNTPRHQMVKTSSLIG